MKTIVLFGATGMVGAYTAISLHEMGYDVIAVGRRLSDNGFFSENGILYYSVNIQNINNFSILPTKNIFAILHFAGAMPAHMQGYNPHEYIDSNITGTLNVLQYASKVGAEKIIFTQSVSDVLYLSGTITPILADSDMRYPLTGDHSVYSITKNAAVSLIRHYEAQYGITAYILRLPTIYAYHPNPYYYVNGERKMLGYRLLISKAEKGDSIEIWGNPQNQKEFVYIDDFIQLCNCCLKSLHGGIYNVGNGYPHSFEEQIKAMIDVFSPPNNKSTIQYCPQKNGSPQFILDISNAKSCLGYNPQYDLLEAFESFKREKEMQRFKKLWGEEIL